MKFSRIALFFPLAGLMAAGCGGNGSHYTFTDRVVESSLSPSDRYDGGTYYEAFKVVALSSGEAIINMEGQECTNCDDSSTIDTHLYIKRLNGDNVAEDADSGAGNDARVRFPVTAGDEFRVVATTGVRDQTGWFRLTVSENLKIAERLTP